MNSHWNAAGWISHAKPIGNKYFSCSTLYRSRSLPSQCKLHIFLIYWILSYTIQQLSFIAYMLQHAKVASWVLCWNVNFVDLMNYTRMHNEEWELPSTLRYKTAATLVQILYLSIFFVYILKRLASRAIFPYYYNFTFFCLTSTIFQLEFYYMYCFVRIPIHIIWLTKAAEVFLSISMPFHVSNVKYDAENNANEKKRANHSSAKEESNSGETIKIYCNATPMAILNAMDELGPCELKQFDAAQHSHNALPKRIYAHNEKGKFTLQFARAPQ